MKNKLEQSIVVNITLASVFKVIFALFIVYLMFVLRNLLLILITSIILASAIEPLTRFFVKKRVPRIIGVLIVYISSIAVAAVALYVFLPPLVNDFSEIARSLPEYVTELSESDRFAKIPGFTEFLGNINNSTGNSDWIYFFGSKAGGTAAGLLSTFSGFFGGIMSTLLIIVFSFYLAVQEDGVVNFIRLIIPLKHEKYAIDLWRRSQRKIGLWMQGQLLLSVIVGVLTYLGLTILGIRQALFLSLLAATFELIPLFGPILASIPAIGFGLSQGGISLGLIVTGMYIIIQQFESQLIHPLVVKKIVGIPALLAIIALIVGGQIAGFLGIIIAVPITAAIMEYVSDVEKRKLEESKNSCL